MAGICGEAAQNVKKENRGDYTKKILAWKKNAETHEFVSYLTA